MVETARKTKINSRLTREYQCFVVSVHKDYHDRKIHPGEVKLTAVNFVILNEGGE